MTGPAAGVPRERLSRAASPSRGSRDRVFGLLVQRLEETVDTIQSAVLKPAREATALVAGIRAALNFIKDLRTARARSRADDEDALFI